MNTWQLILGFSAVFVVMWRHDLRVSLWVCLASIAFILPDWIYGIDICLVNGIVDSFTCILIYLFGRYQWEMKLYGVWLFSILTSWMHSVGIIHSHFTYAVVLEICNWTALVIMLLPWGRCAIVNHTDPIRRITVPLLSQIFESQPDIINHKRIQRLSVCDRVESKV